MGLINPTRVHEISMDSLFNEGESHDKYIPATGLRMTCAFNPSRLESHSNEVHDILQNLPKEFFESTGGGYSFLNMVTDKNGDLCMEQTTADELLMLGIASGWVQILVPREMWSMFPGGVPYIVVYENRKDVNINDNKEAI